MKLLLAERAVLNVQGRMRALMICFTVLSAIFVGLRFISRFNRGTRIGIDDWLLLVARFLLFALLTSGLLLIHWRLGMHMGDLTPLQLIHFGKTLIAFECLYVTSVAFIKVSLVVMFGRIFPNRCIRICAWALGTASVSWSIAIIFVSIFQCTPIEKAWNPSLPGTCIDLKASFVDNAIPNIVTDVLILSLPIPQVWRLHTSISQRISLYFIFLLGSFVIFTSIYRLTTLFAFLPTDISWTLATPCTWVVIEVASGIVSACIPTLRPLVQLVGRHLGLKRTRKQSISQSDGLVTTGSSRKRSQVTQSDNTFGRHSNDVESLQLRPDKGCHQYVKVTRSNTSGCLDERSDTVPSNKIEKRVEVEWQESKESA